MAERCARPRCVRIGLRPIGTSRAAKGGASWHPLAYTFALRALPGALLLPGSDAQRVRHMACRAIVRILQLARQKIPPIVSIVDAHGHAANGIVRLCVARECTTICGKPFVLSFYKLAVHADGGWELSCCQGAALSGARYRAADLQEHEMQTATAMLCMHIGAPPRPSGSSAS